MPEQIIVVKGRTTILQVAVGYDVSGDEFVSEIRAEIDRESDLLATWEVTFATDGTDGELILTLDDSETDDIEKNVGYMDIKRISGGEPFPLFNSPLEVSFQDSVTA